MALKITSVLLNSLVADPGTPSNGQIWHRSDLNTYRVRANGATVTVATDTQLAAYMLASGATAMSGDLDMGGNDITNVGLVDGIDVTAHGSRHDPGGPDAVTTAAAVDVGTVNAAGNALSLSPSNHTHRVTGLAIASEVQGTVLYRNATAWVALAPGAAGEFLQTNGAASNVGWASAGAGSSLVHKSGTVLAASFTGTPRKATVSFSTAFADANYSLTAIARTTNDQSFMISIENSSRAAGSCVLVLDTNDDNDLVGVDWVAIKHGES